MAKRRSSCRGDRPHASPWLLNHLKSAELLWEGAHVRFGLVLSGEKLVDNLDFRQQLKGFASEAIGGEMEGAGLYVACQDQKVDWLLVKGICDWADGHKALDKDERQATAASNATAFVLHALQFATVNSEERRRQVKEQGQVATSSGAGGVAAAIGECAGDVIINSGGEKAPPKAVASSLPAQPYFFGREKELATIREAISPKARTWGALIDGPGGIGKTALAIHAGHLAPPEHFERKIFLSAKVRELTPAGEQPLEDFMLPNYMALLSELDCELGLDTIAQSDPNSAPTWCGAPWPNRRALIVIDNVETFPEAERVRLYQFLSRLPETCKAIVTSRRRTDIDARVVRLDRMERKDALDAAGRVGQEQPPPAAGDEAERIALYEITNGNPLLITWAVGQLGRAGSQCRTIPQVVAFLQAYQRTTTRWNTSSATCWTPSARVKRLCWRRWRTSRSPPRWNGSRRWRASPSRRRRPRWRT